MIHKIKIILTSLIIIISHEAFSQAKTPLINDLVGIMEMKLFEQTNYFEEDLGLEIVSKKENDKSIILLYNREDQPDILFNVMLTYEPGFKELIVMSFNYQKKDLYDAVSKELESESGYFKYSEDAARTKYFNGKYFIVLDTDIVLNKISYSVTIIKKK